MSDGFYFQVIQVVKVEMFIFTESMSTVALPYLDPPRHPEEPHDQGGLAAAAPAADGHLLPGRNVQAQTT